MTRPNATTFIVVAPIINVPVFLGPPHPRPQPKPRFDLRQAIVNAVLSLLSLARYH